MSGPPFPHQMYILNQPDNRGEIDVIHSKKKENIFVWFKRQTMKLEQTLQVTLPHWKTIEPNLSKNT
jgi:hypothetical protein